MGAMAAMRAARGGGMGGGSEKMQEMKAKVEAMAEQISSRLPLPNHLVIHQHVGDIDLVADGQAHDIPFSLAQNKPDAMVRAGWSQDAFVIQLHRDDNTQVTQTYSLSPDGQHLTLVTELKTKKLSDPISIERGFVHAG